MTGAWKPKSWYTFQSASALASGRSSLPIEAQGGTRVSIRVRSRERTMINLVISTTRLMSFNPRPLSRADDVSEGSAGTTSSVSIRVRSRERTIILISQPTVWIEFQSASALASGRYYFRVRINGPKGFNPRPLSRADDDDVMASYAKQFVSIRVRSRERTIRSEGWIDCRDPFQSASALASGR